MYEIKKDQALRTLSKKQLKVDSIAATLNDEITPALQKLEKERKDYMTWSSNNSLIEKLQRFCQAYDYSQWRYRLESQVNSSENFRTSMEEAKEGIQHNTKLL